MSAVELARESLKIHEGFSEFVYKCPSGYNTIGYGRNLDQKGITVEEADYLLDNDIGECLVDLSRFLKCWDRLNETQQAALIDFRYNLGAWGFRLFKKCIAALEAGDYEEAAKQIMDSRYAKQVGRRSLNIANGIRDNYVQPKNTDPVAAWWPFK